MQIPVSQKYVAEVSARSGSCAATQLTARTGGRSFRLPDLRQASRQAVETALRGLLDAQQGQRGRQWQQGEEGFCLVDATAGNGHDSLFLLRLLQDAGAGPEFCVRAFDIQPAALKNTKARIEQADLDALSRSGKEEKPFRDKKEKRLAHGTNADSSGREAKRHEDILGVTPAAPPRPPRPVVADPERPGCGLLRRWQGHLLDHARFNDGLDNLLPFAQVGIAMFNLGFLPGSDKTVVTRPGSTLVALQSLCERMCPGGLLSVHCYAGHQGGREETSAVLDFCRALDGRLWRALAREFINKQRNRELLILVERLF